MNPVRILATILIGFAFQACSIQEKTKNQLPRVIVLTDINNVGGDPDSLRKSVARNEHDAISRIIATNLMADNPDTRDVMYDAYRYKMLQLYKKQAG